jgi:metal-dependent amidase/aminoacylase/carboxypeptidase family protein
MCADTSTKSVLAGLDSVRGWQEDLYRHLHQNPELSHQERRTAAAVAERLRSFGYDVREGVGGTGVVGILHNCCASSTLTMMVSSGLTRIRA